MTTEDSKNPIRLRTIKSIVTYLEAADTAYMAYKETDNEQDVKHTIARLAMASSRINDLVGTLTDEVEWREWRKSQANYNLQKLAERESQP